MSAHLHPYLRSVLLTVDQLNKILDVVGQSEGIRGNVPSFLTYAPTGTPDDEVITRVASPKVSPLTLLESASWHHSCGIQAQAYLRSLPYKKRVPFEKLIPTADPQGRML